LERSDLLLTTAQIGMALAGFAGLVTLLGRPEPRADARLNEIRFRNMVELSLALAAFSLLPFLPVELGASEAGAWRISSAFYAVIATFFVVQSVARNRREMGRILVNGAITMLLIAVCSGIAILLALNTAGAFAAVAGVYFAALFANFLAAAFFFLRLLYGSFPPSEGA
jgi:O-antigen/teichoic acid export membrane protein